MAALSHGVRLLKASKLASQILAQRIFTFSRLVSRFAPPSPLPVPPRPQSIHARLSLPVKHALSRPFSPPRLPKPPAVPANVTQVGLGTARAFHSGRPIFQNMVDNVPIATRALWEAEWDVKTKKKEARRMRRATQNKAVAMSREMLKPRPKPVDASELDAYFPIEPTPPVTTHLLVPLAPTPTARLPLSARTNDGGAHPLLPIADLASIHTSHRLHSLRVSTLFARIDAANVWDDPGVNVDAYAFGPRRGALEKQCTVLRVTFRGWNVNRVRSILGDSSEEWYSLEETHLDGRPTLPDSREDRHTGTHYESPSLGSVEIDSSWASEVEMDDVSAPTQASASAQHGLVLPTLDFSSAISGSLGVPPPPQPVIFLHTASELKSSSSSLSTSSSSLTVDSWDRIGLSSSFLQRVDEMDT